MAIKPQGEGVLVRPIKQEKTTPSGFITQTENAAPDQYSQGLVLAVGQSVSEVEPGETVIFNIATPYRIKDEDEELFIIPEACIIVALCEDEPKKITKSKSITKN